MNIVLHRAYLFTVFVHTTRINEHAENPVDHPENY